MFNTGDRVLFPDPLEADAMTEGEFLEVAVNEPVEVESPHSDRPRLADTAWVRREDGTTARVVYDRIRPGSSPRVPSGLHANVCSIYVKEGRH